MGLGQKDKTKAGAMTMMAFRFCGHPTDEQAHMLSQIAGSCRFLWNRMLADAQTRHEAGEAFFIATPASYKKVPGLEWLKGMDSLALANVQLRLNAAFERFFKSAAGEGPYAGYPHFKVKHEHTDSYTTNLANKENPNIRLDGDMLKLPKIKEPIKLQLHRAIPEGGTLKSVTVTHEPDGKWYFSLAFEYPKPKTPNRISDPENISHIGLDMSLPKLYVDSNGKTADFHKPYRVLERRIAKEQQKLSHMTKGSRNYEKQCVYIAKLHAKAKHQRNDMLHKLSCSLTDQYEVISIEDLNMAAIKKSLHFGKSASDNGWGNFVRMLTYKAERKGGYIIKVDKWFPSSKTCSRCGHVHKELTLADRVYECPVCGMLMDRDDNAAVNIDREGLRIFLSQLAAVA